MIELQPTLFDLYEKHQFPIELLAEMAELPAETINATICGIPTRRDVVEKVLEQVSVLIHQECTVESVQVSLLQEQSIEHARKVGRLLAEIDVLQVRTQQCVSEICEIADPATMLLVRYRLGKIRVRKALAHHKERVP